MAARGGGGSVAVRCNALVAWEGGGWARREVFWVEDVTNFRSERFHSKEAWGCRLAARWKALRPARTRSSGRRSSRSRSTRRFVCCGESASGSLRSKFLWVQLSVSSVLMAHCGTAQGVRSGGLGYGPAPSGQGVPGAGGPGEAAASRARGTAARPPAWSSLDVR